MLGTAREVFGIGRKDAGATFEQNDVSAGRVDIAEFVGENVAGNLGKGAGEFDSGRAGAHDDEIQRLVLSAHGGLALRQFEGQQDAAANLESILDGLQPGSPRFPFVVTEVGMAGASGEDQVVVGNILFGGMDDAALEVEALDLFEQAEDVGVPTKNRADGGGDFTGGKSSGSHLIKQGLKGMVVLAVDDSDLGAAGGETTGGVETGEAGAHNDHAGCALDGGSHYL
jgi:hypothetical protein